MPELKYLKDKKIVFRDEPFVMDVIYSMEKGNASINRWENGRSLPTKMMLLVIRRYCEEHHLEFSCEEVGRLS